MEDKFEAERYELSMERIREICHEETVEEPYLDYFRKTAGFLLELDRVKQEKRQGLWERLTLSDWKKYNEKLYEDILDTAYETSYANPAYTSKLLGEKTGPFFSFLYTELRSLLAYVFEERIEDINIRLELFIEIYNDFEGDACVEEKYKSARRAVYDFMGDYSEVIMERRIREQIDHTLSFAVSIIEESDLKDLRYLYRFGEFISENEIKTAEYLNSLSSEKIEAMARTFTEGYRTGFLNNNIDLSKKKTVNIRYPLGFERVVKESIRQFREMGLEPVIYRAALTSLNKRQNLRIGYFGASPNKQYEYDHRYDEAFYLDKAFIGRKLESLKNAYEKHKALAGTYAGPAVMEVFGERFWKPVNKPECLTLSAEQQKLSVLYQREAGILANQYIKNEETSFTIIAYPVPEIGENFERIFEETVKVNTLDMDRYRQIQQRLIDTLDLGKEVHVKGMNGNKTDILVRLQTLGEPDRETNFENCLADVNIPVGEVFTSPQLKGTKGVLHVSRVFLNDLEYRDLELTFTDGKITNYRCDNFSREEENKKFVEENLLFHHETLPMGEFAIGTNTTAYRMGKKFGISDKLPILIAEKTGPHFAVGDTCYKMSEDVKVWNPDGKEIIAKDNEYSLLRKTQIEKAYFNCHTDITIPYDELGEISVITDKGETIPIIQNGKFVLEGTQSLNDALEE